MKTEPHCTKLKNLYLSSDFNNKNFNIIFTIFVNIPVEIKTIAILKAIFLKPKQFHLPTKNTNNFYCEFFSCLHSHKNVFCGFITNCSYNEL